MPPTEAGADVTIGAHGLAWVNGNLEELLSWDELTEARAALEGEA
jgi:hypothetical protein